jgi:hypothetical protein
MKEKLKEIFRPNIFKIVLTVVFVSWEYFYNFQGYNLLWTREVIGYLFNGFGGVSWNNFFVRNLSLVGIWLLLAIAIYIIILGYEALTNGIHNLQVKRTYANQQPEDFAHLLRTREIFMKTHLLTYLLWTGGIILIFTGFVLVSGLVESLRFSAFDNLYWAFLEGGVEVDYSNVPLLVSSFAITIPLWYIYVSLISWVIKEGRYEEEKDKITEEHFSVIVDDEELKETN